MNLKNRQGGMTLISLILTFVIIGFFALIFMRLLPLYLEDQSIKSAMTGVAADLPGNAPIYEVRKSLGKYFDINNVTVVKPADFQLINDPSGKILSIDYEARAPFISNISFVVEFSHETVLGAATP